MKPNIRMPSGIRKPHRFCPGTVAIRELKRYKSNTGVAEIVIPEILFFDVIPKDICDCLVFFLTPEERFIVKSLKAFSRMSLCAIELKNVRLVDYSIQYSSLSICTWALRIDAPYDNISVLKAFLKTDYYSSLTAGSSEAMRDKYVANWIFEKIRKSMPVDDWLSTFRSYSFLSDVIKTNDRRIFMSVLELNPGCYSPSSPSFPFSSAHMLVALKCNNINALYDLVHLGYQLPFELAYEAAKCGNVEALKFAIAFGTNLNSHITTCCTENDSVGCLKICIKRGITWTIKTILGAIKNNAIECLNFCFGGEEPLRGVCPFPSNFDIDTCVTSNPGIEEETLRLVIEAGYFPNVETQRLIINSIVRQGEKRNELLLFLIIQKSRIQRQISKSMMPIWVYAIEERNSALLELLNETIRN